MISNHPSRSYVGLMMGVSASAQAALVAVIPERFQYTAPFLFFGCTAAALGELERVLLCQVLEPAYCICTHELASALSMHAQRTPAHHQPISTTTIDSTHMEPLAMQVGIWQSGGL